MTHINLKVRRIKGIYEDDKSAHQPRNNWSIQTIPTKIYLKLLSNAALNNRAQNIIVNIMVISFKE